MKKFKYNAIICLLMILCGFLVKQNMIEKYALIRMHGAFGYVLREKFDIKIAQNTSNTHPVISYISSYEPQEKENLEQNYEKYLSMHKPIIEEKEEPVNSFINTRPVLGKVYDYNIISNLDYLKKNYYIVTSVTSLNEKNFDVHKALSASLGIKKDNTSPQILIIHTHSQEAFADSTPGDVNDTIVGVGDRLTQILREKYGYNVIHDKGTYDLVNGKLDRSTAYNNSNKAIERILKENPSIQVVIDLHRDGVDESVRLSTNIEGKPTAQLMYFNGISYTNVNGHIEYLSNPYVQENLTMSLQMMLLTRAYYPDIMRKNYIQGYRYSQHHMPRSMLVEVGAQNNTVAEAMNAMEPFADALDRFLSGEKVY